MRSFPTLGFLSLVGALALVGCGDDDGDGGAGGTAGTGGGGSGGSAGSAGSAGGGAGGSAGTAGMGGGGMGGAGGNGMTMAPCTDCLELVMPAVAGERALGFQFTFPDALDFSDATITWEVIVQSEDLNDNYFVQTFVANGPPEDPAFAFNNYANYTTLTAANFPSGEREIVHDLTAVPLPGAGDAGTDGADAGDAGATLTAFDKRVVRFAGIQIGTAAANTSTDSVRIFVDSVTFEGVSGTPTGTFTMDAEGLAANNYQMFAGVVPPIHHD